MRLTKEEKKGFAQIINDIETGFVTENPKEKELESTQNGFSIGKEPIAYPEVEKWIYAVFRMKGQRDYLEKNIFKIGIKDLIKIIKFTMIHEKKMDQMVRRKTGRERKEGYIHWVTKLKEACDKIINYEVTERDMMEYEALMKHNPWSVWYVEDEERQYDEII